MKTPDKSTSIPSTGIASLYSKSAGLIAGFAIHGYAYIRRFSAQKKYLLLILISVLLIPLFTRILVMEELSRKVQETAISPDEISAARTRTGHEVAVLKKKLAAKKPASCFLVINCSTNEFRLYRGNVMVKKDKCSTGSYILLKNGKEQQWMFKTPKGEFRIRGKITAPVWRKPDWAFVEDGLPVPPANHFSRYEYGVLGDYALSLGDGYLIHGTLYQRFLGLPVTHGCIRLNDENLALVYRSLNTGSRVFIY